MNHPVLASSRSDAKPRVASGLITGGLCGGLAVYLLTTEPTAAPSAAPPSSPAISTATAPLSPAAPAAHLDLPVEAEKIPETATPQVTTPAEMNRLSDSDLPLDQKLAALTTAMRSADTRTATEAARRAVYLIKSADYARLAGPLLLDTSLAPGAMSVLGLNLHDRDVAYTLPLLARIKDSPAHPLYSEAADTLTFHMGNEAGALSGEALQTKVEAWLRDRKLAVTP